ncbi:isoprenylcysteine carboxyl methyltransferase [Peribacillus cavernae]|uniref:Isoprenylcysteine carboxyl methyltransferase n=1 Tax=Peribacillus cavernae TaxID=1674310 RepID=A0A3S0VJA8_9BACI|nr:isoprenylcysteine carboxyl methyltransferase [Peribacillus cavernae]
MFFYLFFSFVVAQRLIELVIARRNEAQMKAKGAFEAGQNHYKWIVLMHTAFLISLFGEGGLLGNGPVQWWYIPFALFIVTQCLRIWSLVSLGQFWNTKIIILPGAKVVARGPYRFMRHPNYVIVATEIIVIPLIFQAYITAIVFTILNAIVLSFRIRVEEQALQQATNYYETFSKRPRFFPKETK